jgi:hypothetical protein
MDKLEKAKERLKKAIERRMARSEKLIWKGVEQRKDTPIKWQYRPNASSQQWPFRFMLVGQQAEFDRSIAKKVRSAAAAYAHNTKMPSYGSPRKAFKCWDTGAIFVVQRIL